jgi:hypothetical protein
VYDIQDTDGAIDHWVIAGPYMQEGKDFKAIFDVPFDPETTGKADWKAHAASRVVLSDLPGFAGNNRAAYLRTRIFSPKAQSAALFVATDDGVKVFLNGKVVHEANVARPALAADRIEVSLRQGWNTLLLKVTNADAGWEAAAKIRGAGGGKPDGVRIRPE